jgi:hypothetical protein
VDDPRIGAAVHQLTMWGFPQAEVCEAVAVAAREVLGRHDHTGRLALGGERIEQIYEGWLKTRGIPVRRMYTRRWLRRRRPPGRLQDLARMLLRGEKPTRPTVRVLVQTVWGWRRRTLSDPELDGDAELAPRGAQALALTGVPTISVGKRGRKID